MEQTDPKGANAAKAASERELLKRSKVSPHLRAVAIDWQRRRGEARAAAPADLTESDPPLVRVLIELVRPDTSELAAAGIEFKHLFGLFYAAQVRLDALERIAELESVLRIHHEPQSEPGLSDSIPEVRANTVRNGSHPFSGTNKFTGLGVMIGIIDSGINVLHPVFRLPNDQTKTRIRAILDQTQTPSVTFNNGQIETAIASNTQIVPPGAIVGGTRVETDTNDHKHGTHVAGIAAGNGKKAGTCDGEFHYVGVAPEAELVIVKHDFAGNASLQAALQFVVNTAAAVAGGGVPCVINMSLGHTIGPHDGTDSTDQMIDTFLAVPRAQPVVLVASAGNDGGLGVHATGTIPGASVVKRLRFEMNAQKSVKNQASTSVEIRFAAPNGVACRLIPPGNNTSGGSNQAPADGATSFTEVTQNSTCTVSGNLVPGAAAGARRINITIQSQATAAAKNQPGEWVIELTNASAAPITYHAWIKGSQWDKLMDDQSRANTTKSPGSARSIISVGNYAATGKDEGKIVDSSSRGPLLDATSTQKPDVSAPGWKVVSAKRDLHTGCCCDCCCESYVDMTGTSMAAPHVTGAAALILERNPALSHLQIKTLLNAHARRDSFTGTTANNDFGSGKLDVLALLNDPLVRGSGPILERTIAPSSALAPEARAAAAVARELPPVPQLQEGTPLWRLLNTPEGLRLYNLGRTHWDEVRALVNTEKRVAVVWHRNYGPLLMHHVTRTSLLPHVPLPRELDGVEVSERAARMVAALEPFASEELVQAMHATLPLIAQLQGKTLLELVEMFEAASLQHA